MRLKPSGAGCCLRRRRTGAPVRRGKAVLVGQVAAVVRMDAARFVRRAWGNGAGAAAMPPCGPDGAPCGADAAPRLPWAR